MASDSQQIDPHDLHDDSIPERMERGKANVDQDATTAGTISVEVDEDDLDVDDAPLPKAYGFDESLVSFEGLGDRIISNPKGVERARALAPSSRPAWRPLRRTRSVARGEA